MQSRAKYSHPILVWHMLFEDLEAGVSRESVIFMYS